MIINIYINKDYKASFTGTTDFVFYVSEEGQQTALCTETTQEVQSSVNWYCSYLLRANALYTRGGLRCLRWLV